MTGRVLRFDDSAHQAADVLLPWLVNGSLKGDERAQVEQHLRECARCRREVEWLHQLHASCAAELPLMDATVPLRRLRERIEGFPLRGRVAWGLSHALGGWQRIALWAKWAIAVEFGALVAIAVLALPVGETPPVYRTLGAAAIRESSASTFAVVFKPGVTESEMRRIVRSVGARVVDGPTETGAYVLAIPTGDPDRAVAALRAEPAVTLVAALTGKQVR